MKNRCAILALLALWALTCASPAFAGLISPVVFHDYVDQYPYGNTFACRASAFWENVAYISGWPDCTNPLFAFDASNPDDLVYRSRAGGTDSCYYNQICPYEDKLYVAAWYKMLKIFDVSTPGQLVYLGEYDRPSSPPYSYYGWGVDVSNDRAYVIENAEHTQGFYIINVSNPGSPALVSALEHPDLDFGGIAVRGSYAFSGLNHYGSVPELNDFRFVVINISDEANPYIIAQRAGLPGGVGWIKLRGDVAYVQSDGIIAYDISDPTNPTELGRWSGVSGEAVFLDNYAFMSTGGNGIAIVNIANPASMWITQQPQTPSPINQFEQSMCGNGRYVYVGTAQDAAQIPPGQDPQVNLYAIESLTTDPDNAGPGRWSAFSLSEPSWDLTYNGDAMPSLASPAWPVLEGSEVWGSVSNGVLRINDTGTVSGDKVKWSHNWDATNTRGATVVVRARCESYNLNGATIPNITMCDGKYTEEFSILSDKIRANNAGIQYSVNGRVWRTYRITTQGNQFKIYIDEQTTPALIGNLSTTATWARVIFGSGSSPATQDIYFDYLYYSSNGAQAPPATISDTTPDVSVNAAETAGLGSLSGIRPETARAMWSTDGGATWSVSGGNQWDCRYQTARLPSDSAPLWTVLEGSETYASLESGLLHINDTSTDWGSKLRYVGRWSASSTTGATVLLRARCASAGADTTGIGNVIMDDGAHRERFRILPTAVQAAESGLSYALDGTQWHTYRMTTGDTTFNVYVDENPSAVITGTLAVSSEGQGPRVILAGGFDGATQDIYYEYVWCSSTGEFAPGQAATWNRKYDPQALPTARPPAWIAAEGSESWASCVSGALRVNDNSTASGSKIKWSRDWRASRATGATVMARVKCVAAGGDTSYVGNLYVEDGVGQEYFGVFPNRIEARVTGLSYTLPDSGQWHTYRITTKNGQFKVYVDEAPAPVISGAFASSSSLNRVMFGSGASAGTQDVYFDCVSYSTEGELAPGQGDGGGSVTVTCTADRRGDRGVISATGIPFNQYSQVWNKLRFSLKDTEGNTGFSPIYTVRIANPSNAIPRPVTNFTATPGAGQISLSWTNPTTSSFRGTLIKYRTDVYPSHPGDGTLVIDKANTPGTSDGCVHTGLTGGVTYYYSAFAHNSAPDYASEANTNATPGMAEVDIPEAKALADGQARTIRNKVVTAAFTGFFYIQEPGGYHGLKALSSTYVEPGWEVDVTGEMGGAGAERFIDCTSYSVVTSAPGPGVPSALGMSNFSLGGVAFNGYTPGVTGGGGPNNVGTRVRIWGKVTAVDSGFFYLDDGSGVTDPRTDPATGQPYKGVRVYSSASASLDEYWTAVGASSLDVVGSDKVRAVQADAGQRLN